MKMPALGLKHPCGSRAKAVSLPRRRSPAPIEFADCDPAQRRGPLGCGRCLLVASKDVGRSDQRFFKVELHYRREDSDAEMILQIAEERAPQELLRLWQDGAIPDPPG